MSKNKKQEYYVENKPATRLDRMEKIDKDKYYSDLHSNMVKWWKVKIESSEEPYDPDAAAEELLTEALGDKLYFDDDEIEVPEGSDEIAAQAMEIYNRLQAEAAADEAAKQAEIEMAKKSWE